MRWLRSAARSEFNQVLDCQALSSRSQHAALGAPEGLRLPEGEGLFQVASQVAGVSLSPTSHSSGHRFKVVFGQC